MKLLVVVAMAMAMACGGKSNTAATGPGEGSATSEGEGSAVGEGSPVGVGSAMEPAGEGSATAQTCDELGGTCTAKMAAIACKAWHETSDCTGNDSCCVQ